MCVARVLVFYLLFLVKLPSIVGNASRCKKNSIEAVFFLCENLLMLNSYDFLEYYSVVLSMSCCVDVTVYNRSVMV